MKLYNLMLRLIKVSFSFLLLFCLSPVNGLSANYRANENEWSLSDFFGKESTVAQAVSSVDTDSVVSSQVTNDEAGSADSDEKSTPNKEVSSEVQGQSTPVVSEKEQTSDDKQVTEQPVQRNQNKRSNRRYNRNRGGGRYQGNYDKRAPNQRSRQSIRRSRGQRFTPFRRMTLKQKNAWVVKNGGPFAAPLKPYFFTRKSFKEYNSVNKWRPDMAAVLKQAIRLMCQGKFLDIKKGPQVKINERLKKQGILQLKVWECNWQLTHEIFSSKFVVQGLK